MKIRTLVKTGLRGLLGMKGYEVFMLWRGLGYIPHLRNPRSLNEKVAHRKLYRWQEIPVNLVDKFEVRDFVARTIGEQYLNELYAVYDTADAIDFSRLPESFVLRSTHGSGMNLIVPDRQGFDGNSAREICRGFLQHRYGYLANELFYDRIPPRLTAEKFLDDRFLPRIADYKFYVFHGRVEFVQVDIGRSSQDHTCRVYDRAWTRMVYPSRQSPADPSLKPKLLGEMLRLAEALAADWEFVRVDLYSPSHERIVFGEITFTPAAGWQKFTDKAFDIEIGSFWRLA